MIEDTGRPEPRDLERVNNAVDDLRGRVFVKPNTLMLKMLHHTGLKAGKALLVGIARASKVKPQECRSKTTLEEELILRKRRLLPQPTRRGAWRRAP